MSRASCQLEALGMHKGGFFWPCHGVRPLRMTAEARPVSGAHTRPASVAAVRAGPVFLDLYVSALK
ncbi:MAG: hypothetical protein M1370_06900 [Bacteroidetes bacterium]|nr:hypothetical protein [Bacteroidota bacterium]